MDMDIKVHPGVDQGSDLIRGIEVTTARVHDSCVCDQLIQGDEYAVYADKAYDSEPRRRRLEGKDMLNGILRRAKRNKPLDQLDQEINRLASKLRAPVERVFAGWKHHRNLRRIRYLGLERNSTHLHLMAFAHNLRCWLRACEA